MLETINSNCTHFSQNLSSWSIEATLLCKTQKRSPERFYPIGTRTSSRLQKPPGHCANSRCSPLGPPKWPEALADFQGGAGRPSEAPGRSLSGWACSIRGRGGRSAGEQPSGVRRAVPGASASAAPALRSTPLRAGPRGRARARRKHPWALEGSGVAVWEPPNCLVLAAAARSAETRGRHLPSGAGRGGSESRRWFPGPALFSSPFPFFRLPSLSPGVGGTSPASSSLSNREGGKEPPALSCLPANLSGTPVSTRHRGYRAPRPGAAPRTSSRRAAGHSGGGRTPLGARQPRLRPSEPFPAAARSLLPRRPTTRPPARPSVRPSCPPRLRPAAGATRLPRGAPPLPGLSFVLDVHSRPAPTRGGLRAALVPGGPPRSQPAPRLRRPPPCPSTRGPWSPRGCAGPKWPGPRARRSSAHWSRSARTPWSACWRSSPTCRAAQGTSSASSRTRRRRWAAAPPRCTAASTPCTPPSRASTTAE